MGEDPFCLMQIFVVEEEEFLIDHVDPAWTVLQLKHHIQKTSMNKFLVSDQEIRCDGLKLHDNHTLELHGLLTDFCTLELIHHKRPSCDIDEDEIADEMSCLQID